MTDQDETAKKVVDGLKSKLTGDSMYLDEFVQARMYLAAKKEAIRCRKELLEVRRESLEMGRRWIWWSVFMIFLTIMQEFAHRGWL